ncbi:MAG TPA: hypothetical protein VG820_11525 [Fimbriimonadaceae bacterium]|nr:hypothetical protein [Fimbriimonadaceae bacterium]
MIEEDVRHPHGGPAAVLERSGIFLFSCYNLSPYQAVRVSANAVPEPTPLAVLAVAALFGLRRKTAPARLQPQRSGKACVAIQHNRAGN